MTTHKNIVNIIALSKNESFLIAKVTPIFLRCCRNTKAIRRRATEQLASLCGSDDIFAGSIPELYRAVGTPAHMPRTYCIVGFVCKIGSCGATKERRRYPTAENSHTDTDRCIPHHMLVHWSSGLLPTPGEEKVRVVGPLLNSRAVFDGIDNNSLEPRMATRGQMKDITLSKNTSAVDPNNGKWDFDTEGLYCVVTTKTEGSGLHYFTILETMKNKQVGNEGVTRAKHIRSQGSDNRLESRRFIDTDYPNFSPRVHQKLGNVKRDVFTTKPIKIHAQHSPFRCLVPSDNAAVMTDTVVGDLRRMGDALLARPLPKAIQNSNVFPKGTQAQSAIAQRVEKSRVKFMEVFGVAFQALKDPEEVVRPHPRGKVTAVNQRVAHVPKRIFNSSVPPLFRFHRSQSCVEGIPRLDGPHGIPAKVMSPCSNDLNSAFRNAGTQEIAYEYIEKFATNGIGDIKIRADRRKAISGRSTVFCRAALQDPTLDQYLRYTRKSLSHIAYFSTVAIRVSEACPTDSFDIRPALNHWNFSGSLQKPPKTTHAAKRILAEWLLLLVDKESIKGGGSGWIDKHELIVQFAKPLIGCSCPLAFVAFHATNIHDGSVVTTGAANSSISSLETSLQFSVERQLFGSSRKGTASAFSLGFAHVRLHGHLEFCNTLPRAQVRPLDSYQPTNESAAIVIHRTFDTAPKARPKPCIKNCLSAFTTKLGLICEGQKALLRRPPQPLLTCSTQHADRVHDSSSFTTASTNRTLSIAGTVRKCSLHSKLIGGSRQCSTRFLGRLFGQCRFHCVPKYEHIPPGTQLGEGRCGKPVQKVFALVYGVVCSGVLLTGSNPGIKNLLTGISLKLLARTYAECVDIGWSSRNYPLELELFRNPRQCCTCLHCGDFGQYQSYGVLQFGNILPRTKLTWRHCTKPPDKTLAIPLCIIRSTRFTKMSANPGVKDRLSLFVLQLYAGAELTEFFRLMRQSRTWFTQHGSNVSNGPSVATGATNRAISMANTQIFLWGLSRRHGKVLCCLWSRLSTGETFGDLEIRLHRFPFFFGHERHTDDGDVFLRAFRELRPRTHSNCSQTSYKALPSSISERSWVYVEVGRISTATKSQSPSGRRCAVSTHWDDKYRGLPPTTFSRSNGWA